MTESAYVVLPVSGDGPQIDGETKEIASTVQKALYERTHPTEEPEGPLKQIMDNPDSLYRYINWEDPIRTLSVYLGVMSILFGTHYLPLTQTVLKGGVTALGVVSLTEFVSRNFSDKPLSARLAPKEHKKIPEPTLNATLKDVHDFIQFAVVQVQRIVFGQDLNKTFATFLGTFVLFWLTKLLTPFWLTFMALNLVFLAPLASSEQGRKAVHDASVRAGELRNAAVEKGSQLSRDGAAKASELSSRGQQAAADLTTQAKNTASDLSSKGQETVNDLAMQARGTATDISNKTSELSYRGQQKASDLSSQAKNTASDLPARGQQTASDISSQARDTASNAANRGYELSSQGQQKASDLTSQARTSASNASGAAANTAQNLAQKGANAANSTYNSGKVHVSRPFSVQTDGNHASTSEASREAPHRDQQDHHQYPESPQYTAMYAHKQHDSVHDAQPVSYLPPQATNVTSAIVDTDNAHSGSHNMASRTRGERI